MAKYVLYTDGSCNVADGIGAWGYAIVNPETDNIVRCAMKKVENTTNNRMELQAIIEGLRQFKQTSEIEVVSDSAYCINCFKQQWYVKWKQNHWYASSGPVKNQDLWQELISLVEEFKHPIVWTHVRGHSGHKYNELVDKMCTQARTGK